MTRKPRRWSSAAIRWESRAGSGEHPTTAHVRVSWSAKRMSASKGYFTLKRTTGPSCLQSLEPLRHSIRYACQ